MPTNERTTLERIADALEISNEEAADALQRFMVEKKEEAKGKKAEKKAVATKSFDWTRVHKTYICMHCGFRWGGVFSLAKGDTTHTFPKTPNAPCSYHTAEGQEEMHLETYVCNCSNCKTFVRDMSREELEDRYLALLHATSSMDAVKRVFHTEVVR